jgi:soluble lytic murein transglycosylase-like protein
MIPAWARKMPWDVISMVASKEDVDPLLLTAIAQVESDGRKYALRYEKNYTYVYKVDEFARILNITRDTEKESQCYSYGFMQIMGAVAREHGFNDPMGELYDPFTNFTYGAKHIGKFVRKYPKLEDAVASYNAGSPRRLDDGTYVNATYVNKVMQLLRALQ